MGVCVPEEYGGAGADFLSYILVLEELSRGGRRRRRHGRRAHERACTLPILHVRHRRAARAVRAAARPRRALGAFALTEPEVGLRRGLARTTRGRATATAGASPARSSGSRTARYGGTFLLFARTDPAVATRARRLARSSSTPSTCTMTRDEEKLGLNSSATNDIVDRCASSTADRLLARGGPRLRDRDGDARRRPDRDRRAGGRDRAGGATTSRAATRRSGERSASRIARVPGDPAQAREHVDGDRRRAAARATARRG